MQPYLISVFNIFHSSAERSKNKWKEQMNVHSYVIFCSYKHEKNNNNFKCSLKITITLSEMSHISFKY